MNKSIKKTSGRKASSKSADQIKSDLIDDLRKTHRDCKNDMNPETSSYERGYYNATEYFLSLLEDRSPMFVSTKPINEQADWAKDGVAPSPEALVDKFIDQIAGREVEFSEILGRMADKILWKLSHDAELHQERAASAKSHLEDTLIVLNSINAKASKK